MSNIFLVRSRYVWKLDLSDTCTGRRRTPYCPSPLYYITLVKPQYDAVESIGMYLDILCMEFI